MTPEQQQKLKRLADQLERSLDLSVRVLSGDVYVVLRRPGSTDHRLVTIRIDPDGCEHHVGEGRHLPSKGVSVREQQASTTAVASTLANLGERQADMDGSR